MRLDAHQHFWSYSQVDYPWIQPGWPIRRDFLPEELVSLLEAHKLEGSIAVQARQCVNESWWLLGLAESSAWIKGVVGWVDLRGRDVEEQLSRLAAHPKFVGVRHVVQDEPDDRFMLRDDFLNGISKLKSCGLAYDILVFSRQLPAAIELVRAFPEQRFVLDHLGKPNIREGDLSPWQDHIAQLAAAPNVMCKVSGLVTEARWHAWKLEDFVPFLDVVFNAFGPDRVMYGSDWPVALLAADYASVFTLTHDYVLRKGRQLEAGVFGLNAARFYNL